MTNDHNAGPEGAGVGNVRAVVAQWRIWFSRANVTPAANVTLPIRLTDLEAMLTQFDAVSRTEEAHDA